MTEEYEITDYTKEVLAHVVVDPDEWIATATATLGVNAVKGKVMRWEQEYLQEKHDLGEAYKTRAQKEDELASRGRI